MKKRNRFLFILKLTLGGLRESGVNVLADAEALGKAAAAFTAQVMKDAIAKQGKVRLVLSTGASQFVTFEALAKQNLDWSKVEMSHLDEYVSLSDMHPASFRKYFETMNLT